MIFDFNSQRHFDWLFTYSTNTSHKSFLLLYLVSYFPDSSIRNSIAFLIAKPRDLTISSARPEKSITIW